MIGKTISHYKILEELGRGGMGVVYKAEDTKLQRFVAIKILPPHLNADEEATRRFIHEARAASSLDHSNIGTIYEINETGDGQTFIVMAHYEGETLRERIDGGNISVDEALDITSQVVSGLARAHEKGIVHRDIKPSNVIVTERGEVKIIDFGLAKLTARTKITRDGSALGTVAYMSPEQARGKEVDHRTDIWSLGVLLYETITGQKPFEGEYDQAVMYSILNDEPTEIKKLRSDVPAGIEKIINNALAKSPEKRYQRIEELAVDLQSVREKFMSKTSVEKLFRVKHSIAVLPFVDMSPQKDQEYFCDGLAEELINALTHIKSLHVVARTSAFAFKEGTHDVREIGEKLNVDTVLEGSIRKAGERLRITAQLVSAADGYHLWSEKYDRKLEDIFAIQDEISLAIVDKLKIELLGEEASRLVEKRGEGLKRAVEYFGQAVEKDPSYAEAYAGIADSYNNLAFYGYMPSREAIPIARENAKKALEIDNTLADAHSALGYIHEFFDWNLSTAEREYKRAIELNPACTQAHYWYATLLLFTNRFPQALQQNEQAISVDPLSVHAHAQYGWNLIGMLEFDQAEEKLKRVLELNPDYVLAHWLLGWIYDLTSKDDEAIAKLQKAVELSGNNLWMLSTLGGAYGKVGRTAEAREVLAELRERSELEETLTWLEKAYEDRELWLFVMAMVWDPSFERVQDDPRFKEFIEKVRASIR